jgi:predicted MFS family arabinose efflux permease
MSGDGTPQHTAAYRNYVLFILVLVNTVNFVDRQAIAVLMPGIQTEFQLTNASAGAVMGIAFAAFYAVLGFPVARLLDRRRRSTLLALVLAVWSGMTALCGAASNFAMLFLFRIGVGVGEAGAGPASHSLLGDYFRKIQRPAAIGFFSLGVPLGNFLGIFLGGLLVADLGWRLTFVALGLPGLLLALIVWLTVREPVRGGMDDPKDLAALRAGEDIPLGESVKQLWASPTFRIMSFSGALSALCGYGMNMWMPSFLERVHDLDPADYRLLLGACLGIGGGLGAMLGGVITARAAVRDPRAFLLLPALTMVIFAAALLLAVWTASMPVVYAAVFVAAFTQFYLMGPYFAVVQRLAPLRGRAVATAFFFFILSIWGIGLGPLYIGAMNDLFRGAYGEAEGLRLALMTLPVISLIAASIAYFGRNAVVRDADRVGRADDSARDSGNIQPQRT